jgi:hypothetical protein
VQGLTLANAQIRFEQPCNKQAIDDSIEPFREPSHFEPQRLADWEGMQPREKLNLSRQIRKAQTARNGSRLAAVHRVFAMQDSCD